VIIEYISFKEKKRARYENMASEMIQLPSTFSFRNAFKMCPGLLVLEALIFQLMRNAFKGEYSFETIYRVRQRPNLGHVEY
jgi:hypothetical protein